MAPSTRPVTWPPSYVANAATAPARGSAATTGAHHLLQPGPVRTGRLPARGRVVAPGPAEHPVVQALAADPEPAATWVPQLIGFLVHVPGRTRRSAMLEPLRMAGMPRYTLCHDSADEDG